MSMLLETNQKPIIIRKYANRRLYNTSSSRYVTIEDLTKMVKADIEFQVLDTATGQDLTRFTLIQIILDIESEGHKMLPIGMLRQLICFYGDRMEPILSRYLERTMDAFLSQQAQAEEALGATLDSIRGDAELEKPNHIRLIRDEFDQLKAKLDKLEAS
jgi:polyhydroxyalkanoate synthesis repressor PhaR